VTDLDGSVIPTSSAMHLTRVSISMQQDL